MTNAENHDSSEDDKKVLKPTQATAKRLYALSGNKCARPNCEQEILTAEGANLGQMAHIHGEKEGAARWVESMTPEERRAFENLILLCRNCHGLIERAARGSECLPGLAAGASVDHQFVVILEFL